MARLDELERKFEENPRRYFAPLANEYRKAGDAAKAAELCRSQLPDVPGHISGHIVLGQALFDSGDFAGARAALETALALDPENIVALRYLGDIARNTGDAPEAERWYSRTLEADPYNEAATQGLQALREGDAATADQAPVASEAPETHPPAAGAEPATHAPLEGFEPTAHDVEPVHADSLIEPAAEEAVPIEEREPGTAVEVSEQVADAIAEQEPALTETEVEIEAAVPEPAPVEDVPVEDVTVEDVTVEDVTGPAEFTGDLAISAASEASEESTGEEQPAEALPADALAGDAEVAQVAADETALTEAPAMEADVPSVVADEATPRQAESVERFDEAAHEPPGTGAAADVTEPAPADEAMQAEERVMESAAPFVTETMADLYLEQGYPHEALELLLQLAEARPEDERLREKVAHIESVIAARRDAAVAAARAERAETAHAAETAAQAESPEVAATETPEATVEEPAPPDAPFDAAVAEVDSSAFVETPDTGAAVAFEIPPFLPAEQESPSTVREMFARMDRVRPRPASSVTPRPLSRLRSDFVPMPDPGATPSESPDDPFAFPDAPRTEQRVARTSGPQPTFNPSTADPDDFEAWLRGLKGP